MVGISISPNLYAQLTWANQGNIQSVVDWAPGRAERLVGAAVIFYGMDKIMLVDEDYWEFTGQTPPPPPSSWFFRIMDREPARSMRWFVGCTLSASIFWALLSPKTKRRSIAWVKRHYRRLISTRSAIGFVATLVPQLGLVTECWTVRFLLSASQRKAPQSFPERISACTALLLGRAQDDANPAQLLFRQLSSWFWSTMTYHCIYWQPPYSNDDADSTGPVGAGLPASTLALGLRGLGLRKPGVDSRFDMFNISAARAYVKTLVACLSDQVKPSFGYFAGSLLVADAAVRLEPAIPVYLDRLGRRLH